MRFNLALGLALWLTACGGGGGSSAAGTAPGPTATPGATQTQTCAGFPAQPAPSGPAPTTPAGLTVPGGLRIQVIANVSAARELAFIPNGDLLVGTGGNKIYLIPDADASANAGTPVLFATLPDSEAAGVAFSTQACAVFAGTTSGVYRIAYVPGAQTGGAPQRIAAVRPAAQGGHSTTSVATTGNTLYASVGSSCNACVETDATRATIQQMDLSGGGMTAKAVNIRNAIGLAINPNTGTLWAGDAGQDGLPTGHPYEFLDAVSLHSGVVNYGWPNCEENQQNFGSGANCSTQTVPAVEFPAYQTIIGVAIAPSNNSSGPYALPAQYNSGAFVSMHGSWHTDSRGMPVAPPRVAFVALTGDAPRTPVNWSDPTAQWTNFISGFQTASGARIGRPTGIAIGPQGDLFVADDQTGDIYRIRP